MLPTCVMITRQPPVLHSPVDRSVPLTCDLITIPIKVKMQVPWDDSASLLTVLQFFWLEKLTGHVGVEVTLPRPASTMT